MNDLNHESISSRILPSHLYLVITNLNNPLCSKDTFGRAKTWVKELQRQANPNIVIALAGNKSDLTNKRSVEFEEASQYAEENALLFMETSAKNAMNVNEIFQAIGKELCVENKMWCVCLCNPV